MGPDVPLMWGSSDHTVVSKQNSVTEVEALRRKQAQCEEDLEAQLDRLEEVQNLAQEMIRQKHYDSNNIKAKSRALGLRCSTHFLFVGTGTTEQTRFWFM